jgi:hypothetical protein
MQPQLNSKARWADREVGEVSRIIMDPLSHEVSHLVVSMNSTRGRQVPMGAVQIVTDDLVQLRSFSSEILGMPSFKRDDYVTLHEVEIPGFGKHVPVTSGEVLLPFPELERNVKRRTFFANLTYVTGLFIGLPLTFPMLKFLKKPMHVPLGACPVRNNRPMALRFPFALVLLIVCLAVPARAAFEAGMDAYNRGDYATALREWRSLAEQGDAEAQDFLGTLYFKGWGVPQDHAKARQWWEKAAAQGSASPQNDLGLLHANGLGGPQDLVQAHMWYSLAAGNGYEIAIGYRNDLAKQMTPAQIAAAQALAREWKPKGQ